MSSRELAALAGCSRSSLWKIENDQVCPTLPVLERIGRVLKLPISDIVRQDPILPRPQFIDLAAENRPLAMRWSRARMTHVVPDYQSHGITSLLLSLEVGGSTPLRRAKRAINKLCVVLRGRVPRSPAPAFPPGFTAIPPRCWAPAMSASTTSRSRG